MTQTRSIHKFAAIAALAVVSSGATPLLLPAQGGRLKVTIVDADTQQPLAGRMHVSNARGQTVRLRGRDLLVHGDHLVIDGEATLNFRKGHYTFILDVGPEYKPRTGHFQIDDHADDVERIEMHRFVDLAKEGWSAGDMLAVRLWRHADPLLRAEDLRVLPLVVPAQARRAAEAARQPLIEPQAVGDDRLAGVQSVYVEDRGGAVVIHNVQGLDGRLALEHFTSTAAALQYAREHDYHVDVAFAASWDLPLWLAAHLVDSIQLIDSTAELDGTRPLPAGCRRPDPLFFPGQTGPGRWAERLYYHVLSCGLRIGPSAGSGSGLTASPPGINRVYVYTEGPLDYETWWSNLRAGRVFVTNGPLLRPHVLGHPPGHVFQLADGETISLDIGLKLATRDRIEYLEIIKNGEVEGQVQLDKWAAAGGRLPPVHFDESGWVLVRAATNNVNVYQHATTGPYYIEVAGRPRVSRTSVQFFLDWLDELENRDRRENHLSPERQAQIDQAREYWTRLQKQAVP